MLYVIEGYNHREIGEIMDMSDDDLLLAAKNVLTLGCIQRAFGESCKSYIVDTILSQYPTPMPPVQVDPVILGDIHGDWVVAQPINEPVTDGEFRDFPLHSPNSYMSKTNSE